MAKFNKEQLAAAIDKACSTINNQWGEVGTIAAHVFVHCVNNKHDTSLVLRLYKGLFKSDWQTLIAAYKKACKEVIAVDLSTKKVEGKDEYEFKAKLDSDYWKLIKDKAEEKIRALAAENSEGLKLYKPKRKGGSGGKKNGKVTEGLPSIVTNEVVEITKEWESLDKNSEVLKQYKDELAVLYAQIKEITAKYKAEFDLLKEGHAKLAESAGAVKAKEEKEAASNDGEINIPELRDIA